MRAWIEYLRRLSNADRAVMLRDLQIYGWRLRLDLDAALRAATPRKDLHG